MPVPWRKTQKGRIVYDRRRHRFRFRDLYRITKGSYEDWYDEGDKNDVAAHLLYVRARIEDWLRWAGLMDSTGNVGIVPDQAQAIKLDLETRLKRIISAVSIDMLQEIIEAVPGVDRRRADVLADVIYWEGVHFIDRLIYGGK